jgi:D-alanine-D-alanine ligase
MSNHHLLPSIATAKKCGRVAVLMGGDSAERAVSLKSGGFVLQALLDAGVDAFAIDVRGNMVTQLANLEADRVFNLLHGRGGEDGQLQGILQSMGMPFVGSGIKASAVTMDKLMTKRLLAGSGLSTPAFVELHSIDDCPRALSTLGLPLIMKPILEGSSIGMTKVETEEELARAFLDAAKYGPVMAERWVEGTEYTVAWLGGTVLPAIRLETPRVFYDYQAKYAANDTRYICPCGLPAPELEQLNHLVAQSAAITGVRHWARVDVMHDAQQGFQVIEINTVPGMTDHSLVPMAARQAGLDFQQLVVKLVELTLQAEEVAHV